MKLLLEAGERASHVAQLPAIIWKKENVSNKLADLAKKISECDNWLHFAA